MVPQQPQMVGARPYRRLSRREAWRVSLTRPEAFMHIESTEIADVKIVTPRRFADDRGFFSEVFNARAFAAVENRPFVQDNHSWSAQPFTIRGLHFQSTPRAQAKL